MILEAGLLATVGRDKDTSSPYSRQSARVVHPASSFSRPICNNPKASMGTYAGYLCLAGWELCVLYDLQILGARDSPIPGAVEDTDSYHREK